MSPESEHTIIAQVKATGEPFTRHDVISLGGEEVQLPYGRQCLVVVGFDEDTGRLVLLNKKDSELGVKVHRQDLPTISTSDVAAIDQGEIVNSSLMKRKLSERIVYNTDEATRARGGDPNYRIKKPDYSFGRGKHPSKLTNTKKAG